MHALSKVVNRVQRCCVANVRIPRLASNMEEKIMSFNASAAVKSARMGTRIGRCVVCVITLAVMSVGAISYFVRAAMNAFVKSAGMYIFAQNVAKAFVTNAVLLVRFAIVVGNVFARTAV